MAKGFTTDRKFAMGKLLSTSGAMQALGKTDENFETFLQRHLAGDWGVMGEEDSSLNDQALKSAGRLMSAYNLRDGTRIWIITEHDRSATTILLPDEY